VIVPLERVIVAPRKNLIGYYLYKMQNKVEAYCTGTTDPRTGKRWLRLNVNGLDVILGQQYDILREYEFFKRINIGRTIPREIEKELDYFVKTCTDRLLKIDINKLTRCNQLAYQEYSRLGGLAIAQADIYREYYCDEKLVEVKPAPVPPTPTPTPTIQPTPAPAPAPVIQPTPTPVEVTQVQAPSPLPLVILLLLLFAR
jgi:hypothetical protein